MRFGTVGEQGAPARFFVDVSIKSLLQRIDPVRDSAPSVAAPTTGSLMSPADAARGDVEVLITPRATADTVRLQLQAARTTDVVRSDQGSACRRAAIGQRRRVPAPVSTVAVAPSATSAQPRGVQDDTPKVIGIDSIGMSAATYTFQALTGETGDAPPRVFKVEIGNYPDIETAILNHVIDQIRARYPDEITGIRRTAAASCGCRCASRTTTNWSNSCVRSCSTSG